MSRLACLVCLVSFAALDASAQRADLNYLALDETSVRIARVGRASSPFLPSVLPRSSIEAPTEPLQLINAGAKLWQIIKEGKPVAEVHDSYATALPRGADWRKMAGWRPPEGIVYRLTARNLYGVTVVDVLYQVQRAYGGSYNGKGRYLTAITVQPLSVRVLWGYKLSMKASVPEDTIVNIAPNAGDPIAAAILRVDWEIESRVVVLQGGQSCYMQGDGIFRAMDEIPEMRQKALQKRVDRILRKAIY